MWKIKYLVFFVILNYIILAIKLIEVILTQSTQDVSIHSDIFYWYRKATLKDFSKTKQIFLIYLYLLSKGNSKRNKDKNLGSDKLLYSFVTIL